MTEPVPNPSFEAALDAIPVFPLPNVVLFPGVVLPLHVFEPRYRVMLRDVLATHGALVVAQLGSSSRFVRSPAVPAELRRNPVAPVLGSDRRELGSRPGDRASRSLAQPGERDARSMQVSTAIGCAPDESGELSLATVAGGGIVAEHQALPDGRSNILVLGRARLHLETIVREDLPHVPYLRARARVLGDADVVVAEGAKTALVAAATMFAAEVKKHNPTFTFRVPAHATAGTLADVCAYQLVVDPAVRQALLEELDPRARIERVTQEIALQHGSMLRDEPGRVLH